MHVDGESAHPAVGRKFRDRQKIRQRRIVHQNIDRAIGRARCLHQPDALRFGGDVSGDGDGLSTSIVDPLHRPAERALQHRVITFMQRTRSTHHARSFRCEQFGNRLADTARRTGNDGNLPVQLPHDVTPP